jgi:hypothetical protein
VSGSLEALRDELRAALEVKDEHVVINQLARHVVIKVCPPLLFMILG